MSWFREHPATSVIGHTLLVGAAVWAAFTFIFDESRMKLAEARIEAEKARVGQLEAKVGVLEVEIRRLTDENRKYVQWLSQAPNTVPFFERVLQEADARTTALREQLHQLKAATGTAPSPAPQETKRYTVLKELKKGDTFIDERTGAILGFVDVNNAQKAEIQLGLPGMPQESLSGVPPGAAWVFGVQRVKYRMVLSKLNWFTNSAEVTLQEIE